MRHHDGKPPARIGAPVAQMDDAERMVLESALTVYRDVELSADTRLWYAVALALSEYYHVLCALVGVSDHAGWPTSAIAVGRSCGLGDDVAAECERELIERGYMMRNGEYLYFIPTRLSKAAPTSPSAAPPSP